MHYLSVILLSHSAVFACTTLIASDVAKLRLVLKKRQGAVWTETNHRFVSPLLRKPNGFQNRSQFLENWVLSKLLRGNAYVLKDRDAGGRVARLYVLDPQRVTPLISDDGSVFYELAQDNIAGLPEQVRVPASEIIHDRYNCLFHPLVGLSPLHAASLAATQGLNAQTAAAANWGNRGIPGGILTAPGNISDESAERLKTYWNEGFSGKNSGKIAVLGDGLKFEAMTATAIDSQLVEQLKLSAETVCSVFHVPPSKLGLAVADSTYANVESRSVDYYTNCLQRYLEDIESCLDDGLSLGDNLGVEFDVAGLLRMDGKSQAETLRALVQAGISTPNEARAVLDLPPIDGGEALQAQAQGGNNNAH